MTLEFEFRLQCQVEVVLQTNMGSFFITVALHIPCGSLSVVLSHLRFRKIKNSLSHDPLTRSELRILSEALRSAEVQKASEPKPLIIPQTSLTAESPPGSNSLKLTLLWPCFSNADRGTWIGPMVPCNRTLQSLGLENRKDPDTAQI